MEKFTSTGTFVVVNIDDSADSSEVNSSNYLLYIIKNLNLNIKDCFTIYGDFKERYNMSYIDRFGFCIFPSINSNIKEIEFIKHLSKYLMLQRHNNLSIENTLLSLISDNEDIYNFKYDNYTEPANKKLHKENCKQIVDFFIDEQIYEIMLHNETNQYVLKSHNMDKEVDEFSDAWIRFNETDKHYYIFSGLED